MKCAFSEFTFGYAITEELFAALMYHLSDSL